MNYLQDSTSSSISEICLNINNQQLKKKPPTPATTATATSSSTTNVFQNLITYELIRYNIQSGFGFDLKGDRPCIIGSVRKGTIAEQAGLQEGDLVISINNKKVTDLDHDQVVRLVGISKNRLVLQVTKFNTESTTSTTSNAKSKCKLTKGGYKKPRSRSKRNNNNKYSNLTQSSQSTASSSGYGYDINLTANTKTTEDDEDEEDEDDDDDEDLEFYYGAAVSVNNRRRKSHKHDNVDIETEDTEPDDTNLKFKSNRIKPTSYYYLNYRHNRITSSSSANSRCRHVNSNRKKDSKKTIQTNNNVSIESSELDYEPQLINKHKPPKPKLASIKHINSSTQPSDQQQQLNVNDLFAILKPVIKPFVYTANLNQPSYTDLNLCFNLVYMGSLFIPYDTLSNASKLTSIRNSIEHFLLAKSTTTTTNECQTNQVHHSCLIDLNIYTDRIKLTNLNRNNNQETSSSSNHVYYLKSEIAFCGRIKDSSQLFALVVLSQNQSKKLDHNLDVSCSSSSCLIFRYLGTNSAICLDYCLNEIARLYRYQNYVFNTTTPAAPQPAPRSSVSLVYSPPSPPPTYDYFSNNNNYSNLNYEQLPNNTNDLYFNKENQNNDVIDGQLPKDISSLSNIDLENFDSINSSCASKQQQSKPIHKKTPAKVKSSKSNTKKVIVNEDTGNSSQSIKVIKDNLANIFLTNKKPICQLLNDSDVIKTIEIETNKNVLKQQLNSEDVFDRGVDSRSSSIKIKSKILASSQGAFQFLKSKPPSSNNKNENFYDANQVINSIDSNEQQQKSTGQTNSNSNSNAGGGSVRFSYPFFNHLDNKSNQSVKQQTTTAKRLLFNFMNVGNNAAGSSSTITTTTTTLSSNKNQDYSKPAHNLFTQQRRLSEYHQSAKSLVVTDEENGVHSDKNSTNTPKMNNKLNQTKISLMSNSLTEVNESDKAECEIGRVTKWATGFEKLLEDTLGLKIFTEFLKKEFSEENIEFWTKCENFKKLTDPDEMKQKSLEIWNTYLDTSSSCQINVDNKARSNCQDALQNPNSLMFEMAQSQIFSLMKYDSYSRFLKSQMYKDCIVNEMEGKPIRTNSSLTSSLIKADKKPINKQQSSPTVKPNNKLSSSSLNSNTQKDNLESSINKVVNVNVQQSTQQQQQHNRALSQSNSNNLEILSSPSNYSQTSSSSLKNKLVNLDTNNQNEQNLNRKEKKEALFYHGQKLTGYRDDLLGGLSLSTQIPSLTKSTSNSTTKSLSYKASTELNNNQRTENEKNQSLDQMQSSITSNTGSLNNQIDARFCRVLCQNDSSSTMIQLVPGQSVHQILHKMFTKKNIAWYKCDLYFVDDYQQVDQQADCQILGSKEICLVERCLFVLSLIPIAINLCIKSNLNKTVGSVLSPILEMYQLKTQNCAIYLNSSNNHLNLNDLSNCIDGQHVLIVHKQQANFLSQTEIDKFMNVSISDFLPNNINECQIQFDELGILKQSSHMKKQNSGQISNSPVCSTSSSNNKNPSIINPKLQQQQQRLKTCNENQNEKIFIDLLKKAQNYSLEDQRGRIDSKSLQIPEFLLTTSSLIKSQSMTQNLGTRLHSYNSVGTTKDDSVDDDGYNNSNNLKKHHHIKLTNLNQNLTSMNSFNKSSVSLPIANTLAHSSMNYFSLSSSHNNTKSSKQDQLTNEQQTSSTTISRSRSPIVIVYDNEDYENPEPLNQNNYVGSIYDDNNDEKNHSGTLSKNYESTNEINSSFKNDIASTTDCHNASLNSNSSLVQNKSQISYV